MSKSLISKALLGKDLPNPTDKKRLYYIQFFNDTFAYATGSSLQDCINNSSDEFTCNVKKFHTIDSWRDLLQKLGVKFEQVNMYSHVDIYNRTCYDLPLFNAYYDEFNNQYFIVKKSNKECSITLK